MEIKKKLFNEAISNIKDLNPSLKEKEIAPSLLTWKEYYKIINFNDKFHESTAYNYTYDKTRIFKCEDSCKTIKTVKISNLILKYILIKVHLEYAKFDGDKYIGLMTDEEVIASGISPYRYNIVCTHNDIEVGSATDEWGCTLIYVVKEFRNLGIGEQLIKFYRNIYPYKPSGGLTESGYTQLQKYYNWMVKNTLANGIYSQMVKNGELTKDRVKEILSSVNKKFLFSKEKTNKLKDLIKDSDENPIYIIEDNNIIIFDSRIKDIYKEDTDNIKNLYLKDYFYCYIHITDFNGFPQVYNLYGNEKYIKQGIEILASIQGELGNYYFRNFDQSTVNILNNIWNDNNKYIKKTFKDKGYIANIPLNVITPKKDIKNIINEINRYTKAWFKKYDSYGELYDSINEIAYSFVD
jgi:hypothetical protein